MELTYEVNAILGKTLTGENDPLTIEKDPNNKGVLRVVDAAPFAYDLETNKLMTKDDQLLMGVNDGYTGKNIDQMPLVGTCKDIPNLKFLFPLQENGTAAVDLGPNNYTGAIKKNVIPTNINKSTSMRRIADFKTENSFVRIPKDCSLKGESIFTWFAFVEIGKPGKARKLYSESTTITDFARFQVLIEADNTLLVGLRSQDNQVASYTARTNAPLSEGKHIIFVSVSVPNKNITIYIDQAASAPRTYAGTLPDAATFPLTAPAADIFIGASSLSETIPVRPTFVGKMAYVGMYMGRALALEDMESIIAMGGYL